MMRASTWLLLAVLILLAGHWPALYELPLAGLALALAQPIVLAALAAVITLHKIRRRLA